MNAIIDQQPDTELVQKKKFALEYLKNPNEPFKAGVAVFGDDTSKALVASTRWVKDPDVLAYMEEAKEEMGDMHFLPTKADLARIAWDLGNDTNRHVDDRLKALRLYADVRGFIEKQGTIINNNVLTNNKVMLIKDHGTPDAWEQKLAEQQAKLIEDANAPRE